MLRTPGLVLAIPILLTAGEPGVVFAFSILLIAGAPGVVVAFSITLTARALGISLALPILSTASGDGCTLLIGPGFVVLAVDAGALVVSSPWLKWPKSNSKVHVWLEFEKKKALTLPILRTGSGDGWTLL